MAQIGFIGLGLMGSGMAHCLLRAGHAVTVFNRTRERAEPLRAEGARVAARPAEAARGAEFVISMVADDGASQAIWQGEDGALGAASPGALLVESSTLSPGWIQNLARQAAARGCELLDAPVTGSKPQAEAGELNFLVGGSAAALERARPVLLAMGKNTFHFGENGSGAMIKLINNMVAGVQIVALAEGLTLAAQSGLDLNQVADFLSGGPPSSPLVKRKMPALVNRDYTPHFSLRWLHKDLSYGLAEATRRDVPMPTIAAARELLRMGLARGLGDQDFAVIAELLRPQK